MYRPDLEYLLRNIQLETGTGGVDMPADSRLERTGGNYSRVPIIQGPMEWIICGVRLSVICNYICLAYLQHCLVLSAA
jgi:hypothetical protein